MKNTTKLKKYVNPFKVGDIIVGTKSNRYRITNSLAIMKVVKKHAYREDYMGVMVNIQIKILKHKSFYIDKSDRIIYLADSKKFRKATKIEKDSIGIT